MRVSTHIVLDGAQHTCMYMYILAIHQHLACHKSEIHKLYSFGRGVTRHKSVRQWISRICMCGLMTLETCLGDLVSTSSDSNSSGMIDGVAVW